MRLGLHQVATAGNTHFRRVREQFFEVVDSCGDGNRRDMIRVRRTNISRRVADHIDGCICVAKLTNFLDSEGDDVISLFPSSGESSEREVIAQAAGPQLCPANRFEVAGGYAQEFSFC